MRRSKSHLFAKNLILAAGCITFLISCGQEYKQSRTSIDNSDFIVERPTSVDLDPTQNVTLVAEDGKKISFADLYQKDYLMVFFFDPGTEGAFLDTIDKFSRGSQHCSALFMATRPQRRNVKSTRIRSEILGLNISPLAFARRFDRNTATPPKYLILNRTGQLVQSDASAWIDSFPKFCSETI